MTSPPGAQPMARKKPNRDRKRRTRGHVLEAQSLLHVQAVLTDAGFVADRASSADYGYDLIVFTFDAAGRVEPGVVFLQVKATDTIRTNKKGDAVLFEVDARDLRLWMSEINPVFLILYDSANDRAYWLCVRPYCEAEGGPQPAGPNGPRENPGHSGRGRDVRRLSSAVQIGYRGSGECGDRLWQSHEIQFRRNNGAV